MQSHILDYAKQGSHTLTNFLSMLQPREARLQFHCRTSAVVFCYL
jgi:hypothetical protein